MRKYTYVLGTWCTYHRTAINLYRRDSGRMRYNPFRIRYFIVHLSNFEAIETKPYSASIPNSEPEVLLESRAFVTSHESVLIGQSIMFRFSSYTRSLRVTAFWLRFIKNCNNQLDDKRINTKGTFGCRKNIWIYIYNRSKLVMLILFIVMVYWKLAVDWVTLICLMSPKTRLFYQTSTILPAS